MRGLLTRLGPIILACGLSLAGCATVAHGPSYAEAHANKPPPDKAVVYVFRKYAEPTAWGATIYFDRKRVATLNQGGFTWDYLVPGKHVIRAEWAGLSGQKDSKIALAVTGGKTYYLELTGVSRLTGMGVDVYYVKVGSGLSEVKPAHAQKTLAKCCKLQKPAAPQQ